MESDSDGSHCSSDKIGASIHTFHGLKTREGLKTNCQFLRFIDLWYSQMTSHIFLSHVLFSLGLLCVLCMCLSKSCMCFGHYFSVSVVSPCLVKFTVSVVKLTSVLKVQLIALAGESMTACDPAALWCWGVRTVGRGTYSVPKGCNDKFTTRALFLKTRWEAFQLILTVCVCERVHVWYIILLEHYWDMIQSVHTC